MKLFTGGGRVLSTSHRWAMPTSKQKLMAEQEPESSNQASGCRPNANLDSLRAKCGMPGDQAYGSGRLLRLNPYGAHTAEQRKWILPYNFARPDDGESYCA